MKFSKKILLSCLSLVLLVSLAVAGCAAKEPSTQEIIDKATQANADTKSYKFDMEMSIDMDVTSKDEPIAMSITANGSGATDVANNKMQMTMEMKMDVPELGKQTVPASYYWSDGWMYIGMTIPMAGEQWMKTKLDIGDMSAQDQLAQQMEFLKSAGQVSKVGDEVVDGIDCNVLEVIPDMAAIMEWVKSQPTANLQELDLGNLDLAKLFDNLTVKEWVSKKDYLVTKAEVALTMNLTAGDLGIEAPEDEHMSMEMRMVMKFHDYDQPVIIVLPAKALTAKEMNQ